MKSKQVLIAVSLMSAVMGSHSALATTIDVTYTGSAIFGGVAVGYNGGWIAPNPNSDPNSSPYSNTNFANVLIGGDSFTSAVTYDFSTATGQFNTWCVDIYHWLKNGSVAYTVDTGASLATSLNTLRPGTPDGTTRVNQLVQLANQVYSTVDTTNKSAAFQLAVWAITYGAADSSGRYSIDTTNSGFKVNDATVGLGYVSQANEWLLNLGSGGAGNYKLTYLNDGTVNNTQDMVVFTAIVPPKLVTVPEPTTLALLGLGLAGLGFSRRKFVS